MSEHLTKCPDCGLLVKSKGDYCPYCGSRLDLSIVVCPNCMGENRADDKVCRYCGASLQPSYPGQDPFENNEKEKEFSKNRQKEKGTEEQWDISEKETPGEDLRPSSGNDTAQNVVTFIFLIVLMFVVLPLIIGSFL